MTQLVRNTLQVGAGLLMAGALTLPLGGCGMSSLTSGLGNSVFGGSSSAANEPVKAVTEEQLLSAAKSDVAGGPTGASSLVAHGCPRVRTLPSDSNVTIYEDGRIGDGLAIRHRGEITKTARECLIDQGRVTVKYGFSGRVLLGPRGKPGPIVLPVTITLADGQRTRISSDRVQVNVDMALDKPIGYFSAVRTITFDVAEGSRPGDYELSVAFDRTAAVGAGSG